MSELHETPPPPAPVAEPRDTGRPGPGGSPFLVLLVLSLVAGFVVLTKSNRTAPATRPGESSSMGALDWAIGGDGVGLIEINGVISFPDEKLSFGSSAGATAIVQHLKEMRKNDRVKAVVLRVNSPGGTVAASQEICNQVKRLMDAGKPVVVSMADVAASGGYYVSAPAAYIFANPGTLTGSIGVVMQAMKLYEGLQKVGVSFTMFTHGEWKDMGSPYRPFKPNEEALFQKLVDGAYGQFVGAVYDGRVKPLLSGNKKENPAGRKLHENLKDRAAVEKVANGQVYSGEQAFALGLVDELGDLETAVTKAGELVGLKDPKIIKPGASSVTEMIGHLAARSQVENRLTVDVPMLGQQLPSPILYYFPVNSWAR